MSVMYKWKGKGFWTKHVKAWEMSGLTIHEYCVKHDLPSNTLIFQHARITNKNQRNALKLGKAKQTMFIPEKQSTGFIQVMLPNGIQVSFDEETTPEFLRLVLTTAGQLSPYKDT